MSYIDISIWELLEIKKMEDQIAWRLALKASEFSKGANDKGALSKELEHPPLKLNTPSF